jgi:hypothetical protein
MRKSTLRRKHGGDRKSDQVCNLQTRSFADDTAAATGKDSSTISRANARAKALGDDLNDIAGTSLDRKEARIAPRLPVCSSLGGRDQGICLARFNLADAPRVHIIIRSDPVQELTQADAFLYNRNIVRIDATGRPARASIRAFASHGLISINSASWYETALNYEAKSAYHSYVVDLHRGLRRFQ